VTTITCCPTQNHYHPLRKRRSTHTWYGNNVSDNRHWAHKIWLIIQM